MKKLLLAALTALSINTVAAACEKLLIMPFL